MNDYGTELGWGHRDDTNEDNHESHIKHDVHNQMNDMSDGDAGAALTMPDDQMNGNTAADPRSAFDPRRDDYMRDTHDGDYTSSRQEHHLNGTNDRATGSQNSYQRHYGQAQEQQPHHYADTYSSTAYGSHDYYGTQADNAPAFDFANGHTDYALGYQQEGSCEKRTEPGFGNILRER